MSTVYPSAPSTFLLYAGEFSTKYLSPNTNMFDPIWKVVVCVLTLGLFPDIAVLTAARYRKVQKESIISLKGTAKASLPGALWVSENIKSYRLHSDEQKKKILETAAATIGTSYLSFLTELKGGSTAQWIRNFEMQDREHHRKAARTVFEKAHFAHENKVLDHLFENIDDYEMNKTERLTMFKELCSIGVIPPKDMVAENEERYAIALELAKAKGQHVDIPLLKHCIQEYELTHAQIFEVIKAAAAIDHDVLDHIVTYKFTEDERITLGVTSKTTLLKGIAQIADNHAHDSFVKVEMISTYMSLFSKKIAAIHLSTEIWQEVGHFVKDKFLFISQKILENQDLDPGKKAALEILMNNLNGTMNGLNIDKPQSQSSLAMSFEWVNSTVIPEVFFSKEQVDSFQALTRFCQQTWEIYNQIFGKVSK